jgi:hypothetical protein
LLDCRERGAFDWPMTEMEGRSLFISSCSRRELARRRPQRAGPLLPFVLAAVLFGVAVATLVVLVAV